MCLKNARHFTVGTFHNSFAIPKCPLQRNFASLPNRNLNQKFYENRVLDRYSSQDAKKLNEDKLLSSANYVRTELPVRISHWVRDFQSLPYIVGTNPHMRLVYDLYWQVFDEIRKFSQIRSLDDNRRFCKLLSRNLGTHSHVISQLGLGVNECLTLITPTEIDQFMNKMLVARISRRTLAEQHIALSNQFDEDILSVSGESSFDHAPLGFSTQRTGIVKPACDIAQLLHGCAIKIQAQFEDAYDLPPDTAPQIVIEGNRDASFMCVPDNIEYIVYELLKNLVRAILKKGQANKRGVNADALPPIFVTICSNDQDITIRVSDQGGGIPYEILPHTWSYSNPEKLHCMDSFNQVNKLEAKVSESERTFPFLSF
ncbi:[Pyruvate dehydrogenase (acetyl-transferring)] kinase 2, mitochondrial [Mycoemilia scoparia]|uniref:Protein-serine/threonine kinase n=1 Tax=Mycoemilia scoparia TaxID=417184 RepID=A0A9W8A2T9_9FUNG|nr:[Pyruvate dehydrogenase (acetyl-transferring)] kinase 2, mitochondrial [Mycoemilia scoparia]